MANLSAFDMNLLRVLDALLREGSTTRAADRVGLSQPAVSAALSRLRAALGDPLFVRQGQGLVPTERARSLAGTLDRILTEVGSLIAAPKAVDPATLTRDFRLSGTDFFADTLLPHLAQRLTEAAPGVRVQALDLIRDAHIDALEREQIDFVMMPKRAMPSWVVQRPMFICDFVVIARRDHPRFRSAGIAPGTTVPLSLFCDLGHVLISPEGRFSARGDDALKAAGHSRRVVMTMPYFTGALRTVAGSDLISLMPRQYAEMMAEQAGLETYRSPVPVDPVTLALSWHRRLDADAAHRWMRGEILDCLAPLNDTGVDFSSDAP